MKFTNKQKIQLLTMLVAALLIAVVWMVRNPRVEVETKEVPVEVEVPVVPMREVRREPEFRGPPIKQWKPGTMQQMGLLVQGDTTLPLYGKEVRGRRDRYHYYTTTPGQQIYPIPVTHDNRDCMDDIGCQELYGNETVSVLGKTGTYDVKMYRTDDFF